MNEPVNKPKRIAVIDAVRGLAMMGIMMVNLPSINSKVSEMTLNYGGISGPLDELANRFSMIFLNQRFYPIFAFLFGLSMFIFIDNLKSKGLYSYRLMMRRLFFLAIFGILHIMFVWSGDILLTYAWLGFFLVPCFRLSVRQTIWLAVMCLGFSFVEIGVAILSHFQIWQGDIALNLSLFDFGYNEAMAQQVYASGGFLDITKQRIIDYIQWYTWFGHGYGTSLKAAIPLFGYYIRLFGIFLFGLAAGKAGFHRKVFERVITIKRIWIFSFLSILGFFLIQYAIKDLPSVINSVMGIAFACFYICSMVLIASSPRSARFLYFFIPVGRLSLTAYLLHTIFGSLLLYHYGIGLYWKVGPAFLTAMGFVCYFLVFVFCHYWFKYIGMGPVEKIWRRLTFGSAYKNSSLSESKKYCSPVLSS
ncbi:MAG: DUF418 domain-containing protein [Oligoflexales bacterium]|nr:DUF418 domain-containing protein [Oligoflexales bacterium]